MNENLTIRKTGDQDVCIPFTLQVSMNGLAQDWSSKIDFPSQQAADEWLARNKDNPDAIKVEPQGPGKFLVVIAS
jgi:hypothetical protein